MKNPRLLINYLAILAFMMCFTSTVEAQLNIGGKPFSFKNHIAERDALTVFRMPSLNMVAIDQEDKKNNEAGLPFRFGFPFPVDLNLQNAGTWTTLDNGDQIWRLTIAAPGARSINLTYNAFWLPEGATFYLYNEDHSQVIGGFTARNNNSPKGQSIGFATGLIFSDQITLEYYEPKAVAGQGEIAIDQIVHGYREINFQQSPNFLGSSGPCQVNVNCSPEGDNWQVVKNCVAKIIAGGSLCSGTLLNRTIQDFKPYFLTANHCLGGLDAIASPMAGNWMFIWQYESVDCAGTSLMTSSSTTGAILASNSGDSDFALFRLIEDPLDLSPSIPLTYAGWDAANTASPGGVGIHHPQGDIKKISTYSMAPVAMEQSGFSLFGGNYWGVYFDPTTNGHSVTEGGSSGSALFNNSQRVIGQLFGGIGSTCTDPANDLSIYGKFFVSWDGSDFRRRLHDWLDPACPINLAINNNFTLGLYEFFASNEITTTSDISGAVLGDFNAGEQIRLLPGFRAREGVRFSARIRGCSTRPALDDTLEKNMGAGTCVLPSQNSDTTIASLKTRSQLSADVEGFQYFPNPTSDQLFVQFEIEESSTPVTLTLSDTYGRLVQQPFAQKTFDKGQHLFEMHLGQLPKGIYYITLCNSKASWVKKAVKID